MKQVQDRTARPYVYARMRRAGYLLACLALAAMTGACGGSSKKKDTTPSAPGSSSEEPSGMNNGEPGSLDPSAGPSGGDPTAPGAEPGAEPGEPPPPPVTLPNYDPDPREARGAIDQHLRVGTSALAATPPDPETALREARLALAVDGTNLEAAAMVAHAYVLKRQYDTAELVLDDLFKRESAKRNAHILYVYGLVYEKTRRHAEAALAFRQAADADPSMSSALINLGAAQLRNKQYAEATATFERLVNSGKSSALTLTSLGSAYRGRSAEYPAGSPNQAQWLSRAEDAYKRATAADRNYGPAYYNLALLYLDADPFPEGGQPLDTLVRLQRAKTYFDEYKNMPGVDIKLYEERMKDVQKLIKREEKRRKRPT
ncbi:MAG: tetratricopeptide repeat protein [Kofleriaceae bacterium]